MRILSIAYPLAPVRGDTAGGAEQILWMLDQALCAAGHQSFVVACGESVISGQLLGTATPHDRLDEQTQERLRVAFRAAVENAMERCQPDLIHLHGLDFPRYIPPPGVPLVATLHLPPSWYDPLAFALQRPRSWIHCVSRSQEETCPRTPNLLPYISNGVPDLMGSRSASQITRRNFTLSLGRICPEKGYHHALAASRRAGLPFLLAGHVHNYDEHKRYFRKWILPFCGRRARFIGNAGPRRKRRLLASARCLLVPSLAPETSSLVAMEAAMCGTPVVAFRAGALPEIVENNVTGFVVDDEQQMAEAIHECGRLDPQVCRETALRRFAAKLMIARYFEMYSQILARCA